MIVDLELIDDQEHTEEGFSSQEAASFIEQHFPYGTKHYSVEHNISQRRTKIQLPQLDLTKQQKDWLDREPLVGDWSTRPGGWDIAAYAATIQPDQWVVLYRDIFAQWTGEYASQEACVQDLEKRFGILKANGLL